MRVAHALLALAATLTTVHCLAAQAASAELGAATSGGNLMPGITYALIQTHDGAIPHERQWISAVVLWRGRPDKLDQAGLPDLTQLDTARVRLAGRDYRRLQRAAEDSGRWFLGGMSGDVIRAAEYDNNRHQLWVLGRRFDVPARDSAIVVLVDQSDSAGGPPEIAGTWYIPAALPNPFWSKTWSSGDTTFFVHPPPQRTQALLTAALSTVPALRAFLK